MRSVGCGVRGAGCGVQGAGLQEVYELSAEDLGYSSLCSKRYSAWTAQVRSTKVCALAYATTFCMRNAKILASFVKLKR